MASGYVRQAAANISAGLAIKSADVNAEFNQLQSAFDNTTGHDHTGSTSGDGSPIPLTSGVSGVLPVANGGTGSASNYLSCPNILFNSAMEIDQAHEGTSVSLVTISNAYIVDGWLAGFTNASAVVSGQRVADAPAGFTNSLKITVATGAAVASGDSLRVNQNIEANNMTNVGFGTSSAKMLSLSFWVKSSIGSYTMCGALRNFAATRSYPFNITITSANTWEQKSITIPADTAGAWVTTGIAGGAILTLASAVGSTGQGTANTWSAGNFIGTSSCTNTILSTNGATFQVTGIKLEVSPIVTSYMRRSFAAELIECQRYYEKSYSLGTALGGITNDGISFLLSSTGGSSVGRSDYFRVTKRASPSMTSYSPVTGTSGKARDIQNAADINVSINGGTNGFFWTAIVSGTNAQVSLQWTADARL